MTDALGWRKKFGVLAPSTNTIVEPDFYTMRVPGVTAHFSRIHIRDQNLSSDDAFEALLEQIRVEIGFAIDRVMTCEPDYMVMGMSAETFWDGKEGNTLFTQRVSERAKGLRVATGAEACERALKLFGAKRIGVVTPYQPIGDKNVVRFFGDIDFDVVKIKGLRCPTAVSSSSGRITGTTSTTTRVSSHGALTARASRWTGGCGSTLRSAGGDLQWRWMLSEIMSSSGGRLEAPSPSVTSG